MCLLCIYLGGLPVASLIVAAILHVDRYLNRNIRNYKPSWGPALFALIVPIWPVTLSIGLLVLVAYGIYKSVVIFTKEVYYILLILFDRQKYEHLLVNEEPRISNKLQKAMLGLSSIHREKETYF